jgi:steroid Delta-isomerase
MTDRARLDRIIRFFESISPENTGTLAGLYSADAYFKDPFNEVSGHAEIIAIFDHMFRKADEPHFRISHSILQDDDAFILWDFSFRIKGTRTRQSIHGSSHLRFGDDGKVEYHRDYWDPAEELYEKIPVLGSLMRLLKHRARS